MTGRVYGQAAFRGELLAAGFLAALLLCIPAATATRALRIQTTDSLEVPKVVGEASCDGMEVITRILAALP